MNENKESTTKELTTDEIKFPNSSKIYVATNGDTRNDAKIELNVPFREIALSPTRNMQDEPEENQPVRVYDTSGVYTDERVKCDVREGLPTLRRDWIVARGDVEEYVGREILPQDNGYLTKGAEEVSEVKRAYKTRRISRIETSAVKRQKWKDRDADALRTARNHHAGDGICGDS